MSETTAVSPNENNSSENVSAKTDTVQLSPIKWISKNIFFFLFIALLSVFYIAYGHWTDKTLRRINKTQAELKEYQYEYKTAKSEVMAKSEEGEVVKSVAPMGLQLTSDVPKRLVDSIAKEKE